MPRESTPSPQPPEALPARPAALPANPFQGTDGSWAHAAFSNVSDQLAAAVRATQERLARAWDEAAGLGYELGFQAGSRETEAELRAFYEEALTEQEAMAARALQEQAERLEAIHAEALLAQRETTRRELDRLGREQEERVAKLRETVRAETEQELQHRFESELAQVEARVRREARDEVEAELAERVRHELGRELQQQFSRDLQEVEERVRRDTERAVHAAYSERPAAPSDDEERVREARAEGYTQGLNESARRYEEAMTRATLERREAVEAAYRKGFDEAGGQTEKELKASYQEGYRQGLLEAGKEFAAAAGAVPPPLLDEARRQAYENGYEDGRGVGLARGRRQAEAELSAKLQEATRVAYREGFLDGKRTVADAERSWAFGVLHLPPDASTGEVKQHYKRLSMALHPDQNPQLADVFIKNLNRAKQLLDA